MEKMYDKNMEIAIESIKNKKGDDIAVIDFKGKSSVTDYFIICTGNSQPNIKAIADEIEKKLGEENVIKLRGEGYGDTDWVLLDYGYFVVHVFARQTREFYRLEELWNHAKIDYKV